MPRSRHVDRFNMDEDASAYDTDVRDTSDPIWEGYADALPWVAAEARVGERIAARNRPFGAATRVCW